MLVCRSIGGGDGRLLIAIVKVNYMSLYYPVARVRVLMQLLQDTKHQHRRDYASVFRVEVQANAIEMSLRCVPKLSAWVLAVKIHDIVKPKNLFVYMATD